MDNRSKIRWALVLLLLAGISIIVTIRVSHLDRQAKNAPTDPLVNEAIAQARALQKIGKLKEAFTIFEKYANLGYPDAMFHAAKSYSRGDRKSVV